MKTNIIHCNECNKPFPKDKKETFEDRTVCEHCKTILFTRNLRYTMWGRK